MKWTERRIARAQRMADLRAERFLWHEEGVRAGTNGPAMNESGGVATPGTGHSIKGQRAEAVIRIRACHRGDLGHPPGLSSPLPRLGREAGDARQR